MSIDCLDYRRLPGQNPLFLDFVDGLDKVAPFYAVQPLQADALGRRVERVLSVPRFPRKILIEALVRSNPVADGTGPVAANLNRLQAGDAVTVVTGQQVTLFGGPAYSVYKAVTAIVLAAQMRQRGINAVPVFWLAADDSDFEEVRSTGFFGRDGSLQSIRYPESSAREEQMVGTVALGSIERNFAELESLHGGVGFWPETEQVLRDSYRPGNSFREAYAAWLRHFFGAHGLIVFDPLSPEIRSNLGDFFSRAVEDREGIVADLARRNAELSASGYQPQVWVEESESLLFWVDGNNRFKIRFENGRYQAKGRKSVQFSPRDLLDVASRDSAKLGANVLLRPILQDHLFPTLLYVGGPAEVAYFAQLNAISHHWGLETVIVPRAALTIVDRKSQRLLSKYDLTVEQVLTGPRAGLTETIMRDGPTAGLLQDFDELKEQLDKRLHALGLQLKQEDPPLAHMLEKAGRKIFYQVGKVNRRFVANHEDRLPHLKGHLDHLLNRLLPGGHLQERTVNFNQFLAEEGPDFIETLIERVNPSCLSHRVWRL